MRIPATVKMYLIILIWVLLFVPVTSTVKAQCYNSSRDDLPNALLDGDIDHYDISCFDEIPDTYLRAAGNMRYIFVDRSVGWTIHNGLNDLATLDDRYDRSNWTYAHYGHGSWQEDIGAFVTGDLYDETGNYPITVNYDNYDVTNYMSSYLDVTDCSPEDIYCQETSIIHPENGFFADDVGLIEEFERQHPGVVNVHATSSLARNIGTYTSEVFNDQMREYASVNGYELIDIADIESHDSSGNPCYDINGNGYPAICPEYTDDIGHPNRTGRRYIAKGLWVLIAGMAGWQPGGQTTPPPTATNTPTNTLQSPTPTPEATEVPIQGDANGDGEVNTSDYVIWLNNFDTGVVSISEGDFNQNGTIEGVDYLLWSANANW